MKIDHHLFKCKQLACLYHSDLYPSPLSAGISVSLAFLEFTSEVLSPDDSQPLDEVRYIYYWISCHSQ